MGPPRFFLQNRRKRQHHGSTRRPSPISSSWTHLHPIHLFSRPLHPQPSLSWAIKGAPLQEPEVGGLFPQTLPLPSHSELWDPPIPGPGEDPTHVPLQPLQYWPFSSADLYNWKANHPPFSEDPSKLTTLMESLVFSHQPTWDDCQQLLQTLFTTEERERILLEARKNVPGDDGRPTQLQNVIDDGFPLTRPGWDFNTPDGREHLCVYGQALVAGLRGAARRPTNLAKVREVLQGPNELPSIFLEHLLEAYRRYTPFDPMAEEQRASVLMSFVDQSASDIRRWPEYWGLIGNYIVLIDPKVQDK
uniref:uncharacterized protein LOC123453647 n=1 Tax=Jaculus jaculus TaxID=51337 RepID=UPI001E1B2D2C|nr:uncharacterized protein LOC123453647 [Jaculus jaculus]XP_044986769.1 uncharacterized protein LOC123453647 [Jaculus jaculus]XP_044986771.1 uncharacterized protein LOC123453647 [Jaculus jaculus]